MNAFLVRCGAATLMILGAAGCFEVPPLPDSVPGCSGADACEAGEVCTSDGECVEVAADDVAIEIACQGVSGSLVGVLCGERATGIFCQGEETTSIVDCPSNAEIVVCCGESDEACRQDLETRPLIFVESIEADPPDGWDCEQGVDETRLDCSHPGFSPQAEIVATIFCDVQRIEILGK